MNGGGPPVRVERGGDGLWSAAWRRLAANRAAILAALYWRAS
jgi:hypothetical protein